ncbi:hypothetical protein UFOVP191_49 [uncultured Caudovirales phage]|uniref:Uncharacterized protein n=1 Tax=uncultured Caudovirales phage TaxID=2100421 RepID=A0A6J7WJ97_9CAUD|nr:hypothetical protein UFOVP191_49 [uncultured Caudovirales phage]
MLDGTCKCHICGRPYKVYSMMVGDQSACPSCVRQAEQGVYAPDTPEQVRRRNDYFKH